MTEGSRETSRRSAKDGKPGEMPKDITDKLNDSPDSKTGAGTPPKPKDIDLKFGTESGKNGDSDLIKLGQVIMRNVNSQDEKKTIGKDEFEKELQRYESVRNKLTPDERRKADEYYKRLRDMIK